MADKDKKRKYLLFAKDDTGNLKFGVSKTSSSPTFASQDLAYDHVILSLDASPLVPPIDGIHDHRIYSLRNLQDMDKIFNAIHKPNCKRVVVIGAGFIGLEIVEQFHSIKHIEQIHLIERSTTVLPQADEDMAEFLHTPLMEHGVSIRGR
jgi:NADPH-dependent 2,4-dienoyl-CoA reductase/sulfur reductase-like enzyme